MHGNPRRLGERLDISRGNRRTVGPTERDYRKLAKRYGGKRDAYQSGAQPPGAALTS